MAGRARPMQVTCPRCGYDLRGQTEQWTASCPLVGRCVECGLDLDWGRVLVIAEHPWLFEYHWRKRPVRRLATTVGRALRPRRFWREVRLTDPVHLRPAAVVAGVVVVLAMIAAIVMLVHQQHQWRSLWWGTTGNRVAYWTQLIIETLLELPSRMARDASGLFVALFGMPLAFVLVPVTLRRSRVRPAHVLRIWMYSLAAPAVLAIVWIAALETCGLIGFRFGELILDPWRWDLIERLAGRSRSGFNYYYRFWRPLPPRLVLMTIGVVWAWWWWTCACRRYLKLPQAGLLVAMLTLVVTLAGSIAVVWSLL